MLWTADRLIDGWRFREAFPIGQDVRGDEVDRGGKLGMVPPDVQISPVVTGTWTSRFTRWITLISCGVDLLMDPLPRRSAVAVLIAFALDRRKACESSSLLSRWLRRQEKVSPRKTVSLPTTMPSTLECRRASSTTERSSRSLRSGVLVDPGADRDLQTELVGDAGNEFDAAGRLDRCGSRACRAQHAQVGANLRRADVWALSGA